MPTPDEARLQRLADLIDDNERRSRQFDGTPLEEPKRPSLADPCELFDALSEYILASDEPLPEFLVYYLANAFHRIADGESADEAFNLAKRPGRPRDPETDLRELKLAHAVRNRMNGGSSLEEACWDLAQEHNLSEHTIERAYKRKKRWLFLLDDDGNPAADNVTWPFGRILLEKWRSDNEPSGTKPTE